MLIIILAFYISITLENTAHSLRDIYYTFFYKEEGGSSMLAKSKLSRRGFMKAATALGATAALSGCGSDSDDVVYVGGSTDSGEENITNWMDWVPTVNKKRRQFFQRWASIPF